MADQMTPEDEIRPVRKERSIVPTADFRTLLEQQGTEEHIGSVSLEEVHREIHPHLDSSLNSIFEEQLSAIKIYRRDLGESEQDVGRYERTLPNHNNLKKPEKHKLLERLLRERQRLAIANFTGYTQIWERVDPEKKEHIEELKERFEATGEDNEAKAAISEHTRKELDRSLNAKSSYYAEMLQTLHVDGGLSYNEADEIVVKQSLALLGVNSIPEKALLTRELKTEAIELLMSTLNHSIDVWEALFSGKGKEMKSDILGADEEERTKKAKGLYKKTSEELIKRRADYKLRALQYYADSRGEASFDAAQDAVFSLQRLMKLSRLEQIRIMESNELA